MVDITEFIPFGYDNAIKRRDLCRLSGLDDRSMRSCIEKAQMSGEIILNMQDGKGYFRPVLPEEEFLVAKWYSAERGRYIASATKLGNIESALGWSI